MSAQADAGRSSPLPDYRWARRLILIGVLVAIVSLLLLVGGRGSGDGSEVAAPSTAGTSSGQASAVPGDGTDAAPGTGVGPPDTLPGEAADEYRWRTEAAQLREQARDALQQVLDSAPPDPVLRARLERVAAIMDHEAEADALRQKARASTLSSSSTSGPVVASSGSGAGGLTTVVGLVGALGGLLTAAAGLLTAWVSWRKAAAAR